jgi:methionine-rich copper-binding protein CopC
VSVTSPASDAPAAGRFARRASRRITFGLIVLLAPLVIPSLASAHASLETMSPADKSSGPAPTEIVGTFAENLDPSKSSFTLVDAGGAVVAQGGEVVSDDMRKMTLTLTRTLAPGPYTIRWATFSTEDKELARGTTTFTVIPAASVAASVVPSIGPTEGPSLTPSMAASVAVSVAPSPSAAPTTPAASTSDALIPIAVVLVLLVAAGAWLLRGRSRAGR